MSVIKDRERHNQVDLEPMGLTTKEAAELLGISVRMLQTEMAAKRIQWKQIGKLVRFHPEHLRQYMLQGVTDGQEKTARTR